MTQFYFLWLELIIFTQTRIEDDIRIHLSSSVLICAPHQTRVQVGHSCLPVLGFERRYPGVNRTHACNTNLYNAKLLQSCPVCHDPVDCSPPGSSVHGILLAERWSGLPCPPPGIFPTQGPAHVPCISRVAGGSSPLAPPRKSYKKENVKHQKFSLSGPSNLAAVKFSHL